MKTAEEILEQMRIEMPFHLPQRIRPYLVEAMNIYAKSVAQQALENASGSVMMIPLNRTCDCGNSYQDWYVDKSSITNPDNIPLTI